MTLKQIDESDEENDMGVVKKETLLEEGHHDKVDEKGSQEQHVVDKESPLKGLYTSADESDNMDEKHAAKEPIPLPHS